MLGCTASEHTPSNQEVVDWPTGCWAFIFLSSQLCVLKQVLIGVIFLEKIMVSCAAWGKTSLKNTQWTRALLEVYRGRCLRVTRLEKEFVVIPNRKELNA